MKKINLLFIVIVMCLMVCSCNKNTPYGSPLALYKNGTVLVELGMSPDTVKQILGNQVDESESFLKYDGLDLYFENSELCAITCSNSKYTDYQGISIDKGNVDLTGFSDFLLGSKVVRFDEKQEEIDVVRDNDKGFKEQEQDVRYYIIYTVSKNNDKMISEFSIGSKKALIGIE